MWSVVHDCATCSQQTLAFWYHLHHASDSTQIRLPQILFCSSSRRDVTMLQQECATVPAKPFPEPTNGKAVALWKNVKDVVLPEARHTHGTNDSSDNPGVGASSIGGWGSSSMAGVAEAAMIAASTASRGLKKANLPPTCLHGDNGRGNGSTSSSCGSGQGPGEKCTSPGPARSSAEEVGGTQLGDDGEDCSPKMMRQESYYLRGQIEAVRDNNLLTTIADCIPGVVPFYSKVPGVLNRGIPANPFL